MTTLIITLALILLLGFYNGQFIMWDRTYTDEKRRWSARWHRTGFLIRGGLFLIVLLGYGLGWSLIAATIAWPVYNGIIARYLGQAFFYIGKTAWFDRNLPHWLHYTLYLFMLLAGLALLIFEHSRQLVIFDLIINL